jgi:hypothetical protein
MRNLHSSIKVEEVSAAAADTAEVVVAVVLALAVVAAAAVSQSLVASRSFVRQTLRDCLEMDLRGLRCARRTKLCEITKITSMRLIRRWRRSVSCHNSLNSSSDAGSQTVNYCNRLLLQQSSPIWWCTQLHWVESFLRSLIHNSQPQHINDSSGAGAATLLLSSTPTSGQGPLRLRCCTARHANSLD